MGQLLPRLKKGERRVLAESLGVTTRTLWNWQHITEEKRRPAGRPPHSHSAFRKCLFAVARVLRKWGYQSGEWCVMKLLGGKHSRTLVRRALRVLKRRHRNRRKKMKARLRLSIEALARDVIWSLDATFIGRCGNDKVEAQLVVDPFAMTEITISLGVTPSAADAIRVIEEARRVRGQYPLVLVTDNGPCYTADEFEEFLQSNGILHLVNLPYTPQHNCWVERENRAVKEQLFELLDSKEWNGEKKVTMNKLAQALACALQRNNSARRWKRGRRTAKECDSESRVCYKRELRMQLAEQVRRTIAKTAMKACNARQRRQQERKSILVVLESGGWIRLTRGSKPKPWSLSERIR